MESIKRFIEIQEIPKLLKSIFDLGERIKTLVNNMLSFSRKGESLKSDHDIKDIVESSIYFASTVYDMQNNYDFKKNKN